MTAVSREVRLRRRPAPEPRVEDFAIVEVTVSEPGDGEVMVRNVWMSVDPYMRGRLFAVNSIDDRTEGAHIVPYDLDAPLDGTVLGRVEQSRHPDFRPGDWVRSRYGWRERFTVSVDRIERIELDGLPPEAHLSVDGMLGLTPYVGLTLAAPVRPGDVVLVSGAAGAVGSLACQIAKLRGCRVIGTAGGPEKVRFLTDVIGVDAAIDYKAAPDLAAAIRAAAPAGIDVYFDNVGGPHLAAALSVAKRYARFALCGQMSTYADGGRAAPLGNLMMAITKDINLRGFEVHHHAVMMADFRAERARWVSEGRLRWPQTVVDGLDNAPAALLGLYRGANIGKMVVRLAPE